MGGILEVGVTRELFLKLLGVSTWEILRGEKPLVLVNPEIPGLGVYPYSSELAKKWGDWRAISRNPHIALTNESILPQEFRFGLRGEPIRLVVNWATFNKADPSRLRNDIWRMGPGVTEAVGRGQEVFLVVELPCKATDLAGALPGLAKYAETLAKTYSLKGEIAHFVIGNEMNVPHLAVDQQIQDLYAKAYVAMAKSIRAVNSGAAIYPYGEACVGRGEVMKTFLQKLKDFGCLGLVSGLCFHSYSNNSDEPRARANLYSQICTSVGVPDDLHITELGRAEGPQSSPDSLAQLLTMYRLLTNATALLSENTVRTVFWHTADPHGDENKHSVLGLNSSTGRLCPTDRFWCFQVAARMLARNVRYFEEMNESRRESVVTVWSTDIRGREFVVSWRKILNTNGELERETIPVIRFNG